MEIKTLRIFLSIILYGIISCCALQAQEGSAKRSYTVRGVVRHGAGSATVVANDPRPLSQAITAVAEEYGWVVHFEEPLYRSDLELVDDTAPQWRVTHLNSKGVRIAAGHGFQSDFLEKSNLATSSDEEERVLNKIVSDYNQSGNPGKYAVRKLIDGSFSIVGIRVRDNSGADVDISAIFDTPIDVPRATRSAWETLNFITEAISERAGVKVVPGTVPTNLVIQSQVTIGGDSVPARDLLVQILLGTKRKLVWRLYCDADVPMYALNVGFAQVALYDSSGKRTTIPVDEDPSRRASSRLGDAHVNQ